jgi:hypothetical protein
MPAILAETKDEGLGTIELLCIERLFSCPKS